MKRLFYTIIFIAAAALTGCGESGKTEKALDITGTWELSDIQITKAAQLGDEKIEVTITFNADKSFALSQILGAGREQEFSGTWELSGKTLTGKYSNGKAWGSAYEISIDGTEMTMVPEGGAESYIYQKTK